MSCANYNLEISQGDDFNISLNLTTSSGTPIDLTTCLISGWIQSKLSYSSGILCNLNPQIVSPPTSGIISLNIPYSNTYLPVDIFPYQVQMINTGYGYTPPIVTKILKGYAYIRAN